MEINTSKMVANEIRKVGLLIAAASKIKMDTSGYGLVDVNQNSGYTYLWLEDYPFSLYIPPFGDDDVYALWTNPENGDEEEIEVKSMELSDLYDWVEKLEQSVSETENL